MGWSLANIGSLNLDFPKAFWARLCGGLDYVYTLDDLRSQDILLVKHLESIRTAAIEKTDEEFKVLFGDQAFILETFDISGEIEKTIELCSNGRQ